MEIFKHALRPVKSDAHSYWLPASVGYCMHFRRRNIPVPDKFYGNCQMQQMYCTPLHRRNGRGHTRRILPTLENL